MAQSTQNQSNGKNIQIREFLKESNSINAKTLSEDDYDSNFDGECLEKYDDKHIEELEKEICLNRAREYRRIKSRLERREPPAFYLFLLYFLLVSLVLRYALCIEQLDDVYY